MAGEVMPKLHGDEPPCTAKKGMDGGGGNDDDGDGAHPSHPWKAHMRYQVDLAAYIIDTAISSKKGQTIGLLLFWVFLDLILIPYEAFAYQADNITLPRCAYEAVMDTLDPKSDDDGQGTLSFLWTLRSLSVMVCLVCTLYVNVIFGVIVDGIVSKMDELKEGKGTVIENNHTLMLGWNENSLSFIREICAANQSEGGGVIVVLCTRDKTELEAEIYHCITDWKGTKLVVCCGNPLLTTDLLRVSAHLARSITIMSSDEHADVSDAALLRTLLVIKSLPRIIVLAEDDNTYTAATSPVDSTPITAMPKQPMPIPPKNIMLCGWHRDIRDILRLLNHLSAPDTQVDLVNEVPEETRAERLQNDGLDLRSLENLHIRHIEANVAIRRHAQNLRVPQYDCILIMSDMSNHGLASDSLVLASVVMLRAIEVSQRSRKSLADLTDGTSSLHTGRHVHCVSEILDQRTETTINSSPTIRASSDYVMSNDLVSRMLAMVSENRNVNAILDELLGDKGSTFDVLPASRYCEMNERLSFWQLAKRAGSMYEEIVCGYVNSRQRGSPVVLNPTDKADVRTWADYSLIVIREAASKSKLNRYQSKRLMVKVVSATDCPSQPHACRSCNLDETKLPRLLSPAANGRRPSVGLRQCSTSDSLMDEVVREQLTQKLQRNSFNSSGYRIRVENEKLTKMPAPRLNYRRSITEKDTAIQPFVEEPVPLHPIRTLREELAAIDDLVVSLRRLLTQ
ncbi:hypothetical protein DYB32_007552 [Aphanomyces invadans]|uniref:RCK N-terminal domain-containing protein n=1 Tax=Aphanomyces invadans TaxID=157072 RepID=A0A3R6VTB4_9STRA|nr:hypothetical protein DYB32_007552 [Aphanomyces invadans]